MNWTINPPGPLYYAIVTALIFVVVRWMLFLMGTPS